MGICPNARVGDADRAAWSLRERPNTPLPPTALNGLQAMLAILCVGAPFGIGVGWPGSPTRRLRRTSHWSRPPLASARASLPLPAAAHRGR
jgi:hypothetical protein